MTAFASWESPFSLHFHWDYSLFTYGVENSHKSVWSLVRSTQSRYNEFRFPLYTGGLMVSHNSDSKGLNYIVYK